MEKSDIIERIKALHGAGQPLNILAAKRRYPELIEAVYRARPYWGWKKALEEAGLQYDQIQVELIDKVRCEICGFEGHELTAHLRFKHPGVTAKEYRRLHPGAEVTSETRRQHIYKESKAHLLPHWETVYSMEYMMDRVAEYHRLGYPITNVWILRNDHNLWQHIFRMGIPWLDFLARMSPEFVAAGQPVQRYLRMTKEEIMARLRELAVDGLLPSTKDFAVQHRELLVQIRNVFKNYTAALNAVGLRSPVMVAQEQALARESGEKFVWRITRYTEAEVLEQLKARLSAGQSLRLKDIRKEDRRLFASVRSLETGYYELCATIGYRRAVTRPAKYKSREEVIEGLRKRAANGLPMNYTSLVRGPHLEASLMRAANAQFGSYHKSLQAAGLPPVTRRSLSRMEAVYANPEAVLEAIRQRHQKGLPMAGQSVKKQMEGKILHRDARRYFKSWMHALNAAGLNKKGVPFPPPRPRPENLPAPTFDEILAFARQRHAEGRPMSAEACRADPEARRYVVAAIKLVGKWAAVLSAAGIPAPEYKRIRHTSHSPFSLESRLQRLRAMTPAETDTQADVPADAPVVEAQPPTDDTPAVPVPEFPSWAKRPLIIPKKRRQSAPGDPASAAPIPAEPDPSQEIIAAIKRRAAEGKSMKYAVISLGPPSQQDRDLYERATRFFGGWKRALEAAQVS